MLLLYVERVRLITDLRDVYLYRYGLVNTGSTRSDKADWRHTTEDDTRASETSIHR
jgi:hypothetical protein